MCSVIWLKWLENQVLPEIRRGLLVVDRAPYHLVLTYDTRPAISSMHKALLADSLVSLYLVPDDWAGGD